MFDIVVIQLLLQVVAWFTLWYNPASEVSARIDVLVALLLTAVALKFSIGSMLPKISTLTFLDKYTMVTFVTILALCLEVQVVGAMQCAVKHSLNPDVCDQMTGFGSDWSSDKSTDVELWFQRTFGSVWVIYQSYCVGFGIEGILHMRHQRKENEEQALKCETRAKQIAHMNRKCSAKVRAPSKKRRFSLVRLLGSSSDPFKAKSLRDVVSAVGKGSPSAKINVQSESLSSSIVTPNDA